MKHTATAGMGVPTDQTSSRLGRMEDESSLPSLASSRSGSPHGSHATSTTTTHTTLSTPAVSLTPSLRIRVQCLSRNLRLFHTFFLGTLQEAYSTSSEGTPVPEWLSKASPLFSEPGCNLDPATVRRLISEIDFPLLTQQLVESVSALCGCLESVVRLTHPLLEEDANREESEMESDYATVKECLATYAKYLL